MKVFFIFIHNLSLGTQKCTFTMCVCVYVCVFSASDNLHCRIIIVLRRSWVNFHFLQHFRMNVNQKDDNSSSSSRGGLSAAVGYESPEFWPWNTPVALPKLKWWDETCVGGCCCWMWWWCCCWACCWACKRKRMQHFLEYLKATK